MNNPSQLILQDRLQENTPAAEQSAPSFTSLVARGHWPSSEDGLPLVMDQHQYAHLRGVTVRTLQRERNDGRSIPYVKDGKKIYYAKHHVLERYVIASAGDAARRAA